MVALAGGETVVVTVAADVEGLGVDGVVVVGGGVDIAEVSTGRVVEVTVRLGVCGVGVSWDGI